MEVAQGKRLHKVVANVWSEVFQADRAPETAVCK